MKNYLFILSILFFIVSCKRETVRYDKPYFDFDSLVQAQLKQLSKLKTVVAKKSKLNSKTGSVSFAPDTAQWKHELDPFIQLDAINKPMFKEAYHVQVKEDDHSNLQILECSSKIKSPVPWVKFYYQNDLKKLKKIESIYEEGNLMFSSQRKLLLEFDTREDQLILTHYQVKGFQKMILSDTTSYLLDGAIRFQ
ncbi:MAG TPA: hypothetical protein DGG95_11295 [Cytophagales bacterium]|jgi:hypothetical protein|nr:hypothetical protein [Cytophagales bacterium]